MAFRFNGRDGEEYEVDPAAITKLGWTDDEGDREVEGHGHRWGGSDQELVDHLRFDSRDGEEHEVDLTKVTKIAWTDDDGDHEVEGHGFKAN